MAAMLYQKTNNIKKRWAHLCPLVLLFFRPRRLGHGGVSWEQTVAGRGGGDRWWHAESGGGCKETPLHRRNHKQRGLVAGTGVVEGVVVAVESVDALAIKVTDVTRSD